MIRCQRGKFNPDGSYEEPHAILGKLHGKTLDAIKIIVGPRLKAEAERRGMKHARVKFVTLSDAGQGLPGMWKEHFPGVRMDRGFLCAGGAAVRMRSSWSEIFKKRARAIPPMEKVALRWKKWTNC